MRKVLLIVMTLLLAVSSYSQVRSVGSASETLSATSTDCATAASCVAVAIGPLDRTVNVQISGTFTATAQFEASIGGAWTAIAGPTWGQGAAVSSATAAGAWTFDVSGRQALRVRLSAYTSGTANVSLSVSQTQGPAASIQVPQALGATSSPTFASATLTAASPLVLEGATDDTNEGTLAVQDFAADRTVTMVDAAGPLLIGNVVDIILCGQLPNNATNYHSPITGFPEGNFYAGTSTANDLSYIIGGSGCDAEDNATEATADEVLYANNAVKVLGMVCKVSGSHSANVVLNLRSAAANLTPNVTITIPTSTTTGATVVPTTTDIAAGGTFALRAITTEDLSAQDVWCNVKALVVP